MESTKCRACRSVNHATSIRCINCGAPLHEGAGPIRPDSTTTTGTAAWTSLVPPTPAQQRSPSAVLLKIFGVIVGIGTIAIAVVAISRGFDPQDIGAAFLMLALIVTLFWLWMLIDALMDAKIGWAVAIFFLGTLGALLYLFLGRERAERRIA